MVSYVCMHVFALTFSMLLSLCETSNSTKNMNLLCIYFHVGARFAHVVLYVCFLKYIMQISNLPSKHLSDFLF
jgi:hypothetical protein